MWSALLLLPTTPYGGYMNHTIYIVVWHGNICSSTSTILLHYCIPAVVRVWSNLCKAIIGILIVSHHCRRIKIDYLVKSHVHWQFLVEMLFKHYSDSEMHLKNYSALYKHILQWFIGIMNNDLPPASVFAEHTDGKQAYYHSNDDPPWWPNNNYNIIMYDLLMHLYSFSI